MKRRKFFEIFIVKFLISVPMIAILLFLSTEILNQKALRDVDSAEQWFWVGKQSSLEDVFSKGDFNEVKNQVNFRLNMFTNQLAFQYPGMYAVANVEDEEGNELLNAEPKVFLFLTTRPEDITKRETRVYTCELSYLEQYDSMKDYVKVIHEQLDVPVFPTYTAYVFTKHKSNYMLTIQDGYLDTEKGIFYPGKCTLYPYEYNEGFWTTELFYKEGAPVEVDLTPADVSGLVKYEKGETGAVIDDEEYSSIQITIGQTGRLNDLKDHPYTQKMEQYFNDASGNRYKVSALVRIDFWECYGSFIIFLGCVYTLISLAICAILTAFQYNRQKAFFAMDDYRKTLMNMMAHDLKTPLAAMSGYAQNLKENIQSEKREHYADAICENTEYMNGIIAEVLSLSKLEESGTALNKEKTDFSMLAKECFERLKPLVDEKKEIRFEEGGTYVRKVDKALMTRAMENLMTNAIKYTKDGGCVRIRAVEKPFYHRFVIESSPMEAITVKPQKLWDPFVKGDESRSEKNGSGLGLFIVKNILTKHGLKGKIVVKNDTFQVIIR